MGGLLLRRDGRAQLLALGATASTVAFVFTPQYALGGLFWASTLRYALPGLLIGLILFTVVSNVPSLALTAVLGLLVVVTQMDPVVWSVGFAKKSFFAPVSRTNAVAGIVVTAAVGYGAWALSPRVVSPPSLGPTGARCRRSRDPQA